MHELHVYLCHVLAVVGCVVGCVYTGNWPCACVGGALGAGALLLLFCLLLLLLLLSGCGSCFCFV